MNDTPDPPEVAQPQADQPQVVYVERPRNGMAVAALTLGIIGVVTGLIPLLFWIAVPCGVLALIFGLVARRQEIRRKMATWGAVLGVAAIGLGILGVAIINDAFDDLDDDLECIAEADTSEEIEAC